jgi:5-methylcytosine-specific restriction protein A
MPTRPPSRCAEPGCHALTTAGRCDEHQRAAWETRSKAWGAGSTRRWRTVRAQVLADEPKCRWCGRPAAEVDHIVPLSRGGSRWDRANLQPLCSHCHDVKSEQDRRDRTRLGGSPLTF